MLFSDFFYNAVLSDSLDIYTSSLKINNIVYIKISDIFFSIWIFIIFASIVLNVRIINLN